MAATFPWLRRVTALAGADAARGGPARAVTLGALPDEVLLLVFRALRASCGFDAHAAWRAGASLSMTSARFRRLFREGLGAVSLRAEDGAFCAGDVLGLVRAARPRLTSLEVLRPRARLSDPAALLRARPPGALRSLTLAGLPSRAVLRADELVGLLRAVLPTLDALAVGYVHPVGQLHGVLGALADCGGRLRALSLDNLWVPPHVGGRDALFAAAWRALGPTLRRLALRRAHEPLFDPPFLRALAALCPRLRDFAADGGSFASPYALAEGVGDALGPRLEALAVADAPLGDVDAMTLLGRCPRLMALSLAAMAVSARTLARAVALRGAALERLELTHVADLGDAHVARLARATPRLRDLRLRRCPLLSDEAFPPALCARLEVLDVRDCPDVGDGTLRALAAGPAPLREIWLNGSAFTEAGIVALVRACGKTLEAVDWRFASSARAPPRDRIRAILAGYCRSGALRRVALE